MTYLLDAEMWCFVKFFLWGGLNSITSLELHSPNLFPTLEAKCKFINPPIFLQRQLSCHFPPKVNVFFHSHSKYLSSIMHWVLC